MIFISIKNILQRVGKAVLEPSVTADGLSQTYSSLTDAHLRRIDPRELTPEARALWAAEVARRDKKERGAARVA